MINKLKNTYLLCLVILLNGCAPKVSSYLVKQNLEPIAFDSDVFLFEMDESIPAYSDFIGKIKLGEAGMTVHCNYEDMIDKCYELARSYGANIIEITNVKAPNFFTSCYRVEANLYLNNSKSFLEGGIENEPTYSAKEDLVIDLIQGLKQGEFTFYDIDGYSITQFENSKPFNNKTIKSLKKKFDIDKEDSGSKSDKMDNTHLYFSKSVEEEHRSGFEDSYIYRNDRGTTTFVQLNSMLARNDSIETTFLKLLTNRELPRYIFTPWEVDSIYFANRFIKLGPVCKWQDIRNIQCPHLGQMDWSEFSTRERAEDYIKQRIHITREKSLSDFISQEEIPVIFEGVNTTAQKFALKIKVPKSILGGSNILYIYYVVAKIDQKYVGCILSHYSNDDKAPGLPPLLSEVMSFGKK